MATRKTVSLAQHEAVAQALEIANAENRALSAEIEALRAKIEEQDNKLALGRKLYVEQRDRILELEAKVPAPKQARPEPKIGDWIGQPVFFQKQGGWFQRQSTGFRTSVWKPVPAPAQTQAEPEVVGL